MGGNFIRVLTDRRCRYLQVLSLHVRNRALSERLDYNPSVGTASIPKRILRVTKWLGTIPAVGVCSFCDRQFYVPLTALKRVADAQESLRVQFAEHKCKSETRS